MSTERPTQSDRELWQRLASDRTVAPGAVSDLDFAAWLEGRLSETAAARIEAAVAADPEMRRAALEVRAKALVGFEIEQRPEQHTGRVGLFDWLFAMNRRFALPRLATMTAAVIIAISGFMLGGGLSESMAQERYAHARGDTANELTEFLVSDGI
jgi:hypothetical protein